MHDEYEKDEAKKAELKKKIEEEDMPKYFGILEAYSTKNNSPDGYIYGNKPTYADFSIYNALGIKMAPNFTIYNAFGIKDNFPRIGKLKAAVEALPKVAEWLKKRPETEN